MYWDSFAQLKKYKIQVAVLQRDWSGIIERLCEEFVTATSEHTIDKNILRYNIYKNIK